MWLQLLTMSARTARLIMQSAMNLPRGVWLFVVACLVVLGGRCYHQRSVAASFTRGYAAAVDSAARIAPVYRDRVIQLAGKTDTAIKVVTRRVVAVESVIVRIPDSVRTAFPAVDTALRACSALAQDCAQLRDAIVVERAARDSLDRATGLVVVATRDSVRSFQRRPTHRSKWLTAGAVGLLGWLLGRQ